jgi:hypothetical protein
MHRGRRGALDPFVRDYLLAIPIALIENQQPEARKIL